MNRRDFIKSVIALISALPFAKIPIPKKDGFVIPPGFSSDSFFTVHRDCCHIVIPDKWQFNVGTYNSTTDISIHINDETMEKFLNEHNTQNYP